MEFDFKTMPSRVICILSVLFCTIIGLRLCAPSIVIYSKYGYADPTWTAQRPAQRQQVQQRIAAIGGWQALRQVSDAAPLPLGPQIRYKKVFSRSTEDFVSSQA